MKAVGRITLAMTCFIGTASVANATTVNCTAGQTLSDAIAALAPAANYQNLIVLGACAESVSIPPGLQVAITGVGGASLTPPPGSAGFYVTGKMALTDLSIVGNAAGFNAIFVDEGGYVRLTALRITGGADGVDFAHGASGQIINSIVSVTSSEAVGLFGAGTVEIDAFSAIDGISTTTLSGSSYGVNCAQGNLILNADGGALVIKNASVAGVQVAQCTASTNVASGSQILIGNNTTGIFTKMGGSTVIAGGVTVGGNSNGAIVAQQNGVVSILNFDGEINTIYETTGNTVLLFSCYQGGKIYVPAITGYIKPAPTLANQGCLQVGGP